MGETLLSWSATAEPSTNKLCGCCSANDSADYTYIRTLTARVVAARDGDVSQINRTITAVFFHFLGVVKS